MRFSIGDRVRNIATGNRVVGTVVGMMTAECYISATHTNFEEWNKLFPNWHTKLIYVLKLDKPIRNIRESQFYPTERFPTYESIPEYQFISYPEDDLKELVDERSSTPARQNLLH